MRPIGAEKNRIKEMKRWVMARKEKKHLNLSLCEYASHRSPEKTYLVKNGQHQLTKEGVKTC